MNAEKTSREVLRDLLGRHRTEIVERATDWVLKQSVDLASTRKRGETQGLVDRMAASYEALLLDGDDAPLRSFIDFVTSYRASSEFHISTVLRGVLSFRRGLQEVLFRELDGASVTAEILSDVDDVSFSAVFDSADAYSSKLLATVQTRRREVEEELRVLAETKTRELDDKLRIIDEQRRMLSALSMPIIPVWEGVLLLPLIGEIGADRAQEALERVLAELVATGSDVLLVDITGVLEIDTDVAQSLIRMVDAARLMGAACFFAGVSPAMAQTMTSLDVDLSAIRAFGTLHAALTAAIQHVGFRVVQR